MRVLALTKYGPLAASTRQRFLQYQPALADAGISLDLSPLLGDDHLRRLVAGKGISLRHVVGAYTSRARALMSLRTYDAVWLHCESFPYFPSRLEQLVFRAGRPVVYDFDDAIFHMYDAHPRALVRRVLGTKLQGVMTRASACTCGNTYLAEYARRFCPRTLVVPTVVDTDHFKPAPQSRRGPVTIGWIGSPSTWAHLRPLLPLLRDLVNERGVRICAVGGGRVADVDAFDGMHLLDWREDREVEDLQAFDIGIMPLPDTPFERGKSGYKLIQYMACGLPTVASPVGVNAEIVREGETGFLATGENEWRHALERLIADAELRRRLGGAGRGDAVRAYSLASQAPRIVDLFRSLGSGARTCA